MEWKTSPEPVGYEEAIVFMEERVRQIISGEADELIWLLEHPPLYTAGSSARKADLIDTLGFPVYHTGRGGQYTYHGPGQRVVYAMLNLRERTPDVRLFVERLEQWIITTLAAFGVKGEIREGRVGVWVAEPEAKIAAIGIRIRKWVTYHGIAINLNPDISHYRGIIPCGIEEYGVTSFAKLGVSADMKALDKQLMQSFEAVFQAT